MFYEITQTLLNPQFISDIINMDPSHPKSIQFKSLTIEHKQIILYFHRNFTTAHSTTATRTNFFIRVRSENTEVCNKLCGYGQCGLPPKKPGCYMSNIQDCLDFMELLESIVHQPKQCIQQSDLTKLTREVLQPLQSQLANQIGQLLQRLQKLNSTQRFRAPKCCLQFALMDLLAKHHNKTVTQILLPTSNIGNRSRSFYTASLQPNESMLQNAKQHLKITKCLKFKYNNDIPNLLQLLRNVSQNQIGDKIIVDANCSWSPEQFVQFQSGLQAAEFKDFLPKLLYVEQPFDLDISNIDKWQQIKQKTGIKILADETFRNEADIEKIKKVAHAVNIKTQKTGGVFTTLKAALAARQAGLEVMFGSMCSTQLGCTQTFQYYPLAEYLDVDGALLIKEPHVEGGFIWKQGGELEPFHEGAGLRVLAQKLFEY